MIVEDVLTTGGQVLEAVKTLQDAGAKIERIVAVIDRMEGRGRTSRRRGSCLRACLRRRIWGSNETIENCRLTIVNLQLVMPPTRSAPPESHTSSAPRP